MKSISCLNPVTILNPSYFQFVFSCDFIFYPPENLKFSITTEHRRLIANGSSFYKVFQFIIVFADVERLSLCFINSSGESFPVFIEVPCGHCDACQSKKLNSILQRLNFGVEESLSEPVFVTLTYNDVHLPSDGVSKRDVQLFKKRFSKLCFSKFGVRLKYGVFSEYGHLGRPHYHLLIFNLPAFSCSSYHKYKFLSQMLQFCWRTFPKSNYKSSDRFDFDKFCKQNYKFHNITKKSHSDPYSNGFVNVDFLPSSKAFSYICKYVSKGSNVPAGKNPNFYSLSCNFGVEFVRRRKEFILNNPNRLFVYRTKFGGELKEVYLSGYYIKKLFPSFSTLVPVEFRRRWLYLQFVASNLFNDTSLPLWIRRSVVEVVDYLHRRMPTLCTIVDTSFVLPDYLCRRELNNVFYDDGSDYSDIISSNTYLSYIQECFNYFMSFPVSYEQDVADAVFSRDLFLSGLNTESDPLFKALRYRKQINSLISKSKL